jgi:serine/threonine protein kinase
MADTIDVDRNLLFAVIALQDDLIDQAQFADVCAGWAVRLERPLAELLIERGWIKEQDRAEVERKLERKLKKHRGDVRATLGAVAEIDVRDALQAVKNPRVRQSIAGLPPARGHILVETLVPPHPERDTLRYTLTRLHAEGGLGKVWIAHDTDLNRDVALKEIKPTTDSSPEAWRRFLKEAQITGQLEHPNIVPVYELARRKEDDQPFYTMRFVRGQSLRDAIAEFHRRRAGKPADRLELQRQLLEPFTKVCQAVGYAHSRGVIHRDLKPENVVLGGHGEVILLDWGLAKIVGQSDSDEQAPLEPRISLSAEAEAVRTYGQMGTPAYMAPEQVEGRKDLIDTRTDVYGLGAILFEILTAHPPASGDTLAEVFRKIQTGNLPRVRELESTVPRALEAICTKALAHDPARRYGRPEDLAEDVRRWLLDEPVSVHRDPLAVRFTRWGRHHRTLATSLVVLLAAAVIGLLVHDGLIHSEQARTRKQRDIAQRNGQIAVANAKQALQNLKVAEDAADGLLAEVADVDLGEIPQMELVRQRLLEKAKAGYEQFLVRNGDLPSVRWGAARSPVRLGDVQALIGSVPEADASYRRAAYELESLAKDDPSNADVRRDLARALHGLGVLLKDASRFEQSETALRRAIALREQIAQAPDPSALDRRALADSRYQLGAVLARRGAGPSEEAAYQAALEVLQKLVRENAGRPELRTRLARIRNNLGMLQNESGHAQDAEATFRETLDQLSSSIEGAGALPGPRWQFARAANNLGTLLQTRNRDEAGRELEQARLLLGKLAAEFPAVAQYRQELAMAEYNLGLLAHRPDHESEALAHYKESARLLEELGPKAPRTPTLRLSLARVQISIGEAKAKTAPVESEAALRKALDEQSALLVEYPDVPEYQRVVGQGHSQLAGLLLVPGLVTYNPAAAVKEAEAAQKLFEQVVAARPGAEQDQILLVKDQRVLTRALIAAGRLADAADAAERIYNTRPTDLYLYCDAAAFLIKCAEAAPKTTEGRRIAEESLLRAVGVLRTGIRAKAIRSSALLDLRVFDPLRDREDFQKLKESLEQSPATG